jgi:hypothetical protein
MKQVELVFPEVTTMAEFILEQKLSKVEFDTEHCNLKGLLTDDLIKIAETEYGATVLFIRLAQ